MQPKRDPSDRRYWPARLLGTGKGFGSIPKEQRPDYGGALKLGGSLSSCPDKLRTTPQTVADSIRTVDQEAVKARGRLLAIAVMDRLEESAPSMDVSSLVDTLNGAIKAASVGVGNNGGGVTLNLGSLHLAALQASKQAPSHLLESGQIEQPCVTEDATIVASDDTPTG